MKALLAPPASAFTDAGTGPDLYAAMPTGFMVSALGTTLVAAAPPWLVTVMVTRKSRSKEAEPEVGRLTARAAGRSTVTWVGLRALVAASTLVPEKLSVALAPPEKPTSPAPVAR